ncbi:hypothetical protein BCR32DRAFT_240407 [Anaeromyces robustus]|jgi:hypothetical protein|uniref:Vesicle transport protein n=1 Tax=Anaeromyces robustus TaxID=1754192 RepID=A0A1Y1XN70_9FUNG|nr:hypothetical protein BCR32DRAFT_240407 [Anaeromyces robustus]|eukprot:ORX87115.1 hypothetical protein BCR32DRAFT_240407 [Anaeromyces robustus]
MDFKKLAKGFEEFAEDPNGVIKDIKKKAKEINPEKIIESIDNINKTSDGESIINIPDNIKQNIAEATSSAYNTITGGMDNVKNYSPDNLINNMFKKVWKEDEKILGITVTRGQKLYYALFFLFASVLFLGMDFSLLFITHEFEEVKYSIFFGIWTLAYILGIYIFDRAIPEPIFEKKSKTTRVVARSIYFVTLISCIVIAILLPSKLYSIVGFVVHCISFAWLTTTHIPSYKGFSFSYFTEKSPLLFSAFYNSVEN